VRFHVLIAYTRWDASFRHVRFADPDKGVQHGFAVIALGDARLRPVDEPDHSFDLLVLDAFSSDAIPIHLLTAEAFALYERKLAPNGVILMHLSNRYLDLVPVVTKIA